MIRSKGSKGIFSPTICCMMGAAFLMLTEQGFAGNRVHVSGEVQSYEEGVYRVQTDQAVVKIQNSKLTASLRQELNSNVGQKVQIDIPSSAIISSRVPSRMPASVSVPGGVNGRIGGGR